MVSFIPKKINTGRLGEELRAIRRNKNININEAARRLNIRKEYLLALEADDFEALPAGLYGKNFLKRYAVFLGLNQEDILKLISGAGHSIANTPDPFSQKILNKKKFIIFPRIARNTILLLAVLACFLYLIFYFNNIFSPPYLEVSQPDRNILVKESSILVIGQSESEAEIKINGELVLIDENNTFSKLINLKKGVNSLEISAKKKYSREKSIIRQILVE